MSGARNLLTALAVLLAGACGAPESPPLEPEFEVVEVATHRLQPQPWTRDVRGYGLVTPAEEFEISTDVVATVREVLFDEGQHIEAGEVLVRLDDRQLRLELQRAEAGLAEARASFDQAESTHTRNEAVFAQRVISEQTYRQSEAALRAADAQLRSAHAALDIARQRLGDAEITSPVAGLVSRRAIDPGQTTNPAVSLGVIQLEGRLRIETFVSQKDVNFLAQNMPVDIESPGTPGRAFEGVIESISSSAEPDTGNFEVRISVDNLDGSLRDGMGARVFFSGLTQNNVIALPREALVDRNRRLLVFRVVGDVATAVEPVIGVGNDTSVPLIDGLSAGDEIIVSNLRLISDGQRIRRSGS